jgi:hypothetical protein
MIFMLQASDTYIKKISVQRLLLTIASFHVEFSQFVTTNNYKYQGQRPAEKVPHLPRACIKKF